MEKTKKEKQSTKEKKSEVTKVKKGKDSKKKDEASVEEKIPVRLFEFYKTSVIPVLSEKFSYKNKLQAPRLEKISVNVGVGSATQDPKILDGIAKDIELITGQKPVITKAKKSVSNFKLREGMKIGCKVTLRKSRMYEFLDKFINVTIPRIRDFRGVPDKSFDGNGNYTLGIKEHVIFPEINVDNIQKTFGMDITFVTSSKNDNEALELLKAFGMPFIKRQE